MKRRTFLLGALALTACGTGAPTGELTIAAGEQGGLYLDFATLLATALGPHAVPKATAGSLENLSLLRDHRADLALTLADTATGTDLRALGRVYENYFQLVVRSDDPATAVRDLAGRALSLGARGAGATVFGERLVTAADLGTRIEHLPLAEAAQALADRRIDAFLWSGGLPTPTLSRLDEEVPIRLLPLADVLTALRDRYGRVYEPVSVPAGVYRSTADIPTVGVANLLVCRPDLPDDVADAITRVLVEQAAALVPAQALGTQFLDVRSLIGTTDVPLHPGAAAAYRDLHG
ncbi:TAXI family TRAP transporter solute-binding subunit [Umezawaea sp. Da 62-37]|uniref:TAXI family TRAP transporter solute-binding subunit n=1 Tax=Umezawaea sp. Da 62-37 TaxID=3075927 RepID=UPI0028F71295|nr:TAXI family TRAP transporter solute-binding subunit [Umezawaea sp. Da 62-37]WNV88730.1 TAXI family TRAP transporter solute-binding subunit [Umezawaea sp. Da 62-37]